MPSGPASTVQVRTAHHHTGAQTPSSYWRRYSTPSMPFRHGASIRCIPRRFPTEVNITGTIRSYSSEVRKQLHEELARAFSVAKALGGDYRLEILPGYDATYNDPEVASLISQVTADMVGEDRLEPGEAGMGAEDFGYMTQLAPGAMFNLGAKYDDRDRGHHTPIDRK